MYEGRLSKRKLARLNERLGTDYVNAAVYDSARWASCLDENGDRWTINTATGERRPDTWIADLNAELAASSARPAAT